MNLQTDWLSIYIAIIGTIISALLAYLSYSLNRQSQRTSMQRSIEDLYDKMVDYRAEHPEVMKLCHLWNNESFNAIYRQRGTKEVQWVTYYNYMELVSGFLNSVLYAKKSGSLDRHAYEDHYKLLVKLLVTENHPYFSSIMDFPYLSPLIKGFVHNLTEEGWDFPEKHRRLIGAISEAKAQLPKKGR